MTSKANLYQARVYEAYRAWCKQGKAQESLDSIAQAHDVDPWQIELEHRTAPLWTCTSDATRRLHRLKLG
jgi:hypothetical protein